MSKYTQLENVRVYYDDEMGNIRIISKDERLKGKPFHITLSKDSESFESLFELLDDEKLINDNSTIKQMPKKLELPLSIFAYK